METKDGEHGGRNFLVMAGHTPENVLNRKEASSASGREWGFQPERCAGTNALK